MDSMDAVLLSRRYPLKEDGIRSEYERDIHRIMYSNAFRRLRHKTQVFFLPDNDHICTRLEHVLHVAEISSTIASGTGLNRDLARAIALGHDLGHPPLGHWGEQVLTEIMQKKEYSFPFREFHHEMHGLRVVERLARLDREERPGLNLTFAVRDGIVSHCGEDASTSFRPRILTGENPDFLLPHSRAVLPATPEGCVVRIADKITYAGRDLEDAIRAGLINPEKIEREIPEVMKTLGKNNGEIIGTLVRDIITESSPSLIQLSQKCGDALRELISWNYREIYNTKETGRYQEQTRRGMIYLFEQLVKDLVNTERLTRNMEKLPDTDIYPEFRKFIKLTGYPQDEAPELITLDFIAGMTDNYFIKAISEIFSVRKPY